jgi:hypothetical protein
VVYKEDEAIIFALSPAEPVLIPGKPSVAKNATEEVNALKEAFVPLTFESVV